MEVPELDVVALFEPIKPSFWKLKNDTQVSGQEDVRLCAVALGVELDEVDVESHAAFCVVSDSLGQHFV